MVGVLRLANGFLHCALTVSAAAQAAHDTRLEEHHKEAIGTSGSPSVCDARTINYITHTLPQLCLTRVWTSAATYDETAAPVTPAPNEHTYGPTSDNAASQTSTPSQGPNGTATHHITSVSTSSVVNAETEAEIMVESDTEGRTYAGSGPGMEGSPFMTFEDWKEMMLRQTGQDPQDLRSRGATGGQDDKRIPPVIGDFGMGEEDEISLDFENYLNHDTEQAADVGIEKHHNEHHAGDTVLYEGDKASLHRSKDAGKTCKERFSYSSFDAGATVLKTGRGTQNAKAILIENKDSYMLLECGADSKYVIVELSDDILIDTVVLANFEFFSSMVRQFRVSVSDRYPVKMDKWKEIGTFEARNSRDIQAFLVENPQIWAKYVRIQFETHYGNEYYCPVSLLRIHGSRMLDSWKDMDGGREDELSIDEEEADAVAEWIEIPVPSMDPGSSDEVRNMSVPELDYSPWRTSPFVEACGVCHKSATSVEDLSPIAKEEKTVPHQEGSLLVQELNGAGDAPGSSSSTTQSAPQLPDQTASTTNLTAMPYTAPRETSPTAPAESTTTSSTTTTKGSSVESLSPPTKASTSQSPGQRPRGAATAGAPAASPTVQEGFFNVITKRLQHAETNLTLTMQYLEDHSRYVQESLQKAEQKQLSKVTAFLENLNQTVLAELHGMRDQYDQIWQSTVFALESQREQADRDIVALSSRLNLLADEVVFQKRMAIVQAVLLLCCLFLVIFSRGVPIPYLAPLLDQAGANMPGAPPSYGYFSAQPLYTSHSRQDGVDAHQIDTYNDHPSTRGVVHSNDAMSVSDGKTRAFSTAPRLARLSPPVSPSFEAPNAAAADMPIVVCDLEGTMMRRPTAYHAHVNSSRKPLPALPEHPSSERPSSSSE